MLATTTRRQLILYRYNSTGPLTCLKYKQTLDSICFTNKSPILIFTGDTSGQVVKWEQKHSNQVVFTHETLLKSEFAERESSKIQGATKEKSKILNNNNKLSKMLSVKQTNIILKLLYVESIDLILGACEDASIYVWGFDQEAVKLLKNMKITTPEEDEENKKLKYLNEYYMKLNELEVNDSVQHDLEINQQKIEKKNGVVNSESQYNNSDSVTNRVAGFVLKKILSEHTSCVTSLVLIEKNNAKFLLSGGWDRRICIWDLENIRLYDIFRNRATNNFDDIELACDGKNTGQF
jgi:WD40 repeat protein